MALESTEFKIALAPHLLVPVGLVPEAGKERNWPSASGPCTALPLPHPHIVSGPVLVPFLCVGVLGAEVGGH